MNGLNLVEVDDSLSEAKLFYVESPTSWAMEALDLPTLAALSHKHNVRMVVDNSWATPILQKPLKLGADLALHTASKYFGKGWRGEIWVGHNQ